MSDTNAAQLQQAREILAGACSTLCFSGAGLSAESGIATFRDSETHALWSRFDPMQLASQQGFADNRQRVIDWYNWRRQTLATTHPNPGHRALASQTGLIQITQNVDNLLERAGCLPANVIHLHGDITADRCNNPNCGYREPVDLLHPPALRTCPHCHDWLRPAVVWFGETLPEQAWQQAENLARQCDCLLVVGTSATVYPAAGLIHIARRHQARVIVINTQPSDASGLADVELIGASGSLLPRLLDNLSLHSLPN